MKKNHATKTVMILHVGGDQIRGSEVCLIHAIDAITDNGYKVIVLRKNNCIDSHISKKVSIIIDEPFPEIMLDGSHRTFPLLKYFKSLYRLYKLTKEHKPCVIYCNTGLPCQLAVPVSKIKKIPVLCHFHHPAPKRYFYIWLVKYANKLIFPSNFTRSVVTEKCGRGGEVIYNAVDISNRFTPAKFRDESFRQALNFGKTDIVVGQVGALTEHKRPHTLIQCFADAYKQNNQLRLVLIGGGEMHDELAVTIKELKLDSVAILAGYVPDVLEYYQHIFDINVLASTNEGLGISVIEASACGLPSIVTDCTGLREVVDKNVTGLTFEQDDFAALTNKIVHLSNNAEIRQQMGLAARKKTEKLFSLEKYKDGILSQIKKLTP